MTFAEWLAIGLEHNWISEGVCGMHDALPMTDAERTMFDDGEDPCIPVLRVWIEAT